MAVFGLRQQHAREEGAERGRQPGIAGDRGDADHQQQRHRHDQLAAAGPAGDAEQRPQQETAGDEDHGDRRSPPSAAPWPSPDATSPPRPEDLHAEQDRRDHEVLEQQHGDRDLPERRRGAALLFQQLHDHRGRRHREAEAEDDRRARRRAQQRQRRRRRRPPRAGIACCRCRPRSGAATTAARPTSRCRSGTAGT